MSVSKREGESEWCGMCESECMSNVSDVSMCESEYMGNVSDVSECAMCESEYKWCE